MLYFFKKHYVLYMTMVRYEATNLNKCLDGGIE